jgi:molybdopterin molybdotransferase
VDGYAIHAADLNRIDRPLRVAFTVVGGSETEFTLQPGTAARILTGARLPAETAAVAMQEDVDTTGNAVTLLAPLEPEEGARRIGADFAAGELLLPARAPIRAGVAGLLASQGVTRPAVMALPRCAVITTGDEIVPPDREPGPGGLRDSVGAMLAHAAGPYAIVATAFTPDDPAKLKHALSDAAEHADAVLIVGGASVGDRDFTARVVAELGRIEFHGINVRPGKPLLFGFVNDKPVIGLPGNPASAFVCFHLFGVPLLRRIGGWSDPHHLWFEAPYGAAHEPESRDFFARVTVRSGRAEPVLEQASFGLRSLGLAHALARLPANAAVREGETVQITLL